MQDESVVLSQLYIGLPPFLHPGLRYQSNRFFWEKRGKLGVRLYMLERRPPRKGPDRLKKRKRGRRLGLVTTKIFHHPFYFF